MLYPIEPGTVIPIHWRKTSSESVLCALGHFQEILFDEEWNWVETIDIVNGDTNEYIIKSYYRTFSLIQNGLLPKC